MNHSYRILKYLYKKSGDGEFHKLCEAFPKKKNIKIDFVNQRAYELYKEGYIEVMSDSPPVRFIEESIPTTPQTFDRGKIKSKGEEYIDNITIRLGNFIWRKNSFLYVSIPVIVAIITFIVNILLCR